MSFPSAADLAIANQALGACRARTLQITSFSQTGPEATQINLNYASTRDALLRAFYWNFAKSTVSLGDPTKTYDPAATVWTNSQPPPPWSYEYAMPTNCLAVRAVFGQNGNGIVVPSLPGSGSDIGPSFPLYTFEVANDGGVSVIVTNAPSALAVITLGGLDPSVWDIEFTQAMIALLAATICRPLSGDAGLAKDLRSEAEYWVNTAKIKSANEGTNIQDIMPDWLRARQSNIFDEGISMGGTNIDFSSDFASDFS